MKDTLIKDILNKPIEWTTSKWVIERIPFLFNEDFEAYLEWKTKFSSMIGIDSKAIVFTGSSSVGFSLNPEKNLKSFDGKSDIDVAVISSHYFDISWHFLRNLGPKIYKYNQKEKNSIEDHRTRLIYWGTIATDKILQILPFGIEWVKALNSMAKVKPTEGREINIRIYKDFEALKNYHNIGLKQIKDKLLISN